MNSKLYSLLFLTFLPLLGTSTWAQQMSPATPEAACDPVSASPTRSRALSLPADVQTLRQHIFRLQSQYTTSEDVKILKELYQTQWDLAKQLATQPNQLSNAIATYEQAKQTLQKLRTLSLSDQDKPSQDTLEKFYYGLVDLYLKQAAQVGAAAQQMSLSKAIDTLELFKQAELQSYFQDDCLVKQEERLDSTLIKLFQAPKPKLTAQELEQTTILYPIFFPAQGFERTLELLLIQFYPTATKNGYEAKIIWKQSPVTKPAERLQEIDVQCFRELVETGYACTSVPYTGLTCSETTNPLDCAKQKFNQMYGEYGKKLYNFLLGLLEEELKTTKTLVFVPDGMLYSIPLTALLDPNQTDSLVLMKPYAIVTVPGLTLAKIDRPLTRTPPRLLLGGVNKNESTELHAGTALPMLQKIYDRSTLLVGNDFSINNLQQAMQDKFYNIMHLHTHGTFGSGKADDTYLVTASKEDHLTMDKLSDLISLSGRRGSSIELLTFSACQTAKGDKKAAFGLAGAAFKSGAKSIVATLWNADEAYAARFMALFYTRLRDHPEQTKAQALQWAQQQLVEIAICGRGTPPPCDKTRSETRSLENCPKESVDQPFCYRQSGETPTLIKYWAPFILIGNWF